MFQEDAHGLLNFQHMVAHTWGGCKLWLVKQDSKVYPEWKDLNDSIKVNGGIRVDVCFAYRLFLHLSFIYLFLSF